MIKDVPEGFITDRSVIEVVYMFGGLLPDDEVVLGGDVCDEFQYAVIRLVSPAKSTGDMAKFRTVSAPNDVDGYAMDYASKDGNWGSSSRTDDIVAWRRPVK